MGRSLLSEQSRPDLEELAKQFALLNEFEDGLVIANSDNFRLRMGFRDPRDPDPRDACLFLEPLSDKASQVLISVANEFGNKTKRRLIEVDLGNGRRDIEVFTAIEYEIATRDAGFIYDRFIEDDPKPDPMKGIGEGLHTSEFLENRLRGCTWRR